MMKMPELRKAEELAADELGDPEVRQEYERTAFANAVAIRVIRYRADHGLSQSAQARQQAIARLEAGDHEPSLTMLARLARGLGISFSVDITPTVLGLRDTA